MAKAKLDFDLINLLADHLGRQVTELVSTTVATIEEVYPPAPAADKSREAWLYRSLEIKCRHMAEMAEATRNAAAKPEGRG
jgi:hypothetical protein